MQQHTRLCFIPTMLHWHKDPEHLFCCQFVMWRSASNCAAGLPKLSPPPPLSSHVCAPQSSGKDSKLLPRIGRKNFPKTSARLEVYKELALCLERQQLWAIASSLGVKWWQNKKQAETVEGWEYMWAGEMLQSERIKSALCKNWSHSSLKCLHWQQQINFHTNTDCDF